MPSFILITLNTFMYWLSHRIPPLLFQIVAEQKKKKKSVYTLLKNSTDYFPSHLPLQSFCQLFIHTRTSFHTLLILKLQSQYNKLCRGRKIKICQTDHAYKHLPADIVHADF